MNLLFIIYTLCFGLIIGSFLNCLIWRLHSRESLWGRSHCTTCQGLIAWYDNIPFLSYVNLGGRCRHCKKKISWRYPLVELITAVLFMMAFVRLLYSFGAIETWSSYAWLTLIRDWLFIASLIVIFVTDALWYLIYDEVVLPVTVIVGIINLILGISWQNMLFSATIGSGFFIIQFIVSRGKWIGGGDIRLGLLLGVALGWPLIIPAIFLAYLLGAVVGIGLLSFKKKDWKSLLPLGTFLAIAGVITLFYGYEIINWYLRLTYFI